MQTGDGKLIDIEINKYHPDDTMEDLFQKYEDNFIKIIDELNSLSSRISENTFIVKSDKDNLFQLPQKYNTRQNCIQVYKNGIRLTRDEFEEVSSTSVKVLSIKKGDKITIVTRLYYDAPITKQHAETHKLNGSDELDIVDLADREGILNTLRSMMPSLDEVYNAYVNMQQKFDVINNEITSIDERLSNLENNYSKIKIEGIRVFNSVQEIDNINIGEIILIKDIGIDNINLSGFYSVEEKIEGEVKSPNIIYNEYYLRFLNMPVILNDY